MQKILLVDKSNKPIGVEEKMRVHKIGLLHRAFSILIFNNQGETLIQKRAANKYHSRGLWSNTCCSHQSAGSSLLEQIHIRLEEEMGFDCELKWCYDFSYNHTLSNNLIENEYDMIYVGKYNANPVISGSKKTGNFYKTIYF